MKFLMAAGWITLGIIIATTVLVGFAIWWVKKVFGNPYK